MSSRSSRGDSPTARRRGSRTSAPNGKPEAEGQAARDQGVDEAQEDLRGLRLELLARPLPVPETDRRARRRRSGRRGSPGSSVQTRREAKRAPGAAAAASRASSCGDATAEEDEPRRAGRRAGLAAVDRVSAALRMGARR